MIASVPLIVTRCPVCKKKLALNGTMLPGQMIVCVTCDSHLRVESLDPPRLAQVDPALSRTEDARPEAYG
ncbi:MAG: hypothetical protein KatS3mg057_0690 [Herpetosiphonaceae bacterium]|nr:MAG: hypothetical protein KatS3mg057_0690 [Herpetosiphonaceae bacterium]